MKILNDMEQKIKDDQQNSQINNYLNIRQKTENAKT